MLNNYIKQFVIKKHIKLINMKNNNSYDNKFVLCTDFINL